MSRSGLIIPYLMETRHNLVEAIGNIGDNDTVVHVVPSHESEVQNIV